jgi:hypothetical protein
MPSGVSDAASGLPSAVAAHAGREELRVIEDHLGQLDQQIADLLAAQHDAVQRLAESPRTRGRFRRSRSSRRSAPPRRRFPPQSISPGGWAPAPPTRRVPA